MSNRPKLPSSHTFQIWGWIFFVLSSFFFLAAGIRSGDWMSILGSVWFLFANILFIIGMFRE